MDVNALKKSNFLKKEDCGAGILCTIDHIAEENVAKEGAPEELRWCLYLKESEKPMVLNSTNGQLIAQITGQRDTDNWPGHKVVLYNDPSVSFGGKIMGGIRIRAPKIKQPATPAATKPAPKQAEPQPEASEDSDIDSIPF